MFLRHQYVILEFSSQSLLKDARDRDRHVCFVRLLLQKIKSLQVATCRMYIVINDLRENFSQLRGTWIKTYIKVFIKNNHE